MMGALVFSLLACVGTQKEDSSTCLLDTDCPSGQLCDRETSQCEEGCIDDNDCPLGSSCVGTQGGESVCVLDDEEQEDPVCIEDTDCADQERCLQGACERSEGFTRLLIKDTTASDVCEREGDGSDLVALFVTDGHGEVIGHARRLATITGVGSRFSPEDAPLFDGMDNGIREEGVCDRSEPESKETLGCGGALLVDFLADQGAKGVTLSEDLDVLILERGNMCGDEDADRFDVYACDGPKEGCTRLLAAGAQGITRVLLTKQDSP